MGTMCVCIDVRVMLVFDWNTRHAQLHLQHTVVTVAVTSHDAVGK